MPATTNKNPNELMAQADQLITKQKANGAGSVSTAEHADAKAALIAASREAEAAGDQAMADRLLDKAETLTAYQQLAHAAQNTSRGAGNRTMDIDRTLPEGRRTVTIDGNALYRAIKPVRRADLDNLDDGGFAGLSDFLKAVVNARTGNGFDARLEPLAGQMRGSDPYGGFLLPHRLQAEVIMSADEQVPWLAQRRMFEARGGDLKFPILADRDRSSEDVGGYKLSRTAESTTITEDTAVFESRKATLHKAAGLVRVSTELLEDSAVGINELLNQIFGRAASLLQALDFVGGTGVGEPLGILNSPALYSVAKEGGQVADTIIGTNLVKMRQRCRMYERAIWLAHPSTVEAVASAHIAGTNSDVFLFAPGNGTEEPDTLIGRPIYFTEAAELLGDKGDVMLVVPSAYAYLSRPMRIDMSMHVGFKTDDLYFRQVMRDDGMPLFTSTLTDAQGYEQSEFCVLAERA